ncbi:MAG: response regulator [Melioribacteraceae bacterium]|nr:response regulator [Melioribacteraceae bacterium]
MLKFLIVDDDQSIRELLKIILKKNYACNILEAENGEKALEILKTESPNIVFLDLSMPVLDGKEALIQIRNNVITKNIPVIIITALNEKEIISDLVEKGICDYILKPFDKTDTIKRINKILARKTSGKEKNETDISGLPRLMLVENDNKLRLQFHELFGDKFIIVDAKNGSEALTVFNQHFPRFIVISDKLSILDKKIITLRILEQIKNGEVSIYLLMHDKKSLTAKVFQFDGVIFRDENLQNFKNDLLSTLLKDEITT